MSILIRPAKTSDIKKIREIVSHYISERRLLAKETVTLYESVQEFSVAEVNGEVVGCGAKVVRAVGAVCHCGEPPGCGWQCGNRLRGQNQKRRLHLAGQCGQCAGDQSLFVRQNRF